MKGRARMSKELSPLEALFRLVSSAVEDDTRTVEECLEYQHIIETALKRLETLEEEKQSFDRQLEKKLKALEIIKEKIDVGVVILGDKPKIRITYNGQLRFYDIAQEEYELLKEVLL